MVDNPPPAGETLPEIAARHGAAYNTARTKWSRHPAWPDPVGKRGRWLTYDPADADAVIAKHFERRTVTLEPNRLYTAAELETAGIGVKAGTIRADLTRGRWPAPDDTTDGINRWTGITATQALSGRRTYRRSTS